MLYLDKRFLVPKEVSGYYFKTFKDLTQDQHRELAMLFATVFNADNINVLEELGIQGKTLNEGLWAEEPYTLDDALEIIKDYLDERYLTCVALEKDSGNDSVIGAMIIQKRDKQNMISKGYKIEMAIPENTEFWCEVDTFKREVLQNGVRISGLTQKMREEILSKYKNSNPILLYSSTNNPYMVKAWKKDGFEIVDRMTTFGNKYQSYKLIN